MVESMIVGTPALGPVTTSWVCLNFLLIIYGKNFGMDLICLPLNKLDFILGMDLLEFNYVNINCFDKSVSFLELDASNDLFVSAKQVDELMKNDANVFMMIDSIKAERKTAIGELPVVCDFPEVFPDDTSDLSSEHEIEFVIDLVPDTSHVLMEPYIMFASELSELRKKLEEFLENNFVRLSVSSWGRRCC